MKIDLPQLLQVCFYGVVIVLLLVIINVLMAASRSFVENNVFQRETVDAVELLNGRITVIEQFLTEVSRNSQPPEIEDVPVK